MFNIALFEPEIPPNTGNIIRLCANAGSQLHLIEPLGFSFDDKRLRRAGLDYHEFVGVKRYADLPAFYDKFSQARVFAITTKGQENYDQPDYQAGDVFLFGPETRGLPDTVIQAVPENRRIRIPMLAGQRSLNLSNAASILLYEAWRQAGFAE